MDLKFYRRVSDTQNLLLKALLQHDISDPVFYGDLVYKFKRIVGKANFSDQSKNIIKRYKKKLDVKWMSCDSLWAWL